MSEHLRRGRRRPSAPTEQGQPHYAASATRCREYGNGYPAGGLCVGAGHRARWRRIFPVCRARHRQVDPRRLFHERDDAHCSGASGTYKRIDFVHLLDEARPGALGH